jgi:hypothetical protein
MKLFRAIALFCQLFAVMASAQTPGLLTSDERYRNIPLLPTYSGVKYNEIPVKVSLKKYCPVPGNQGQSGACVGWAVGYGALSIQRAILSNMTDQARITQEANSAAFLYNQVRRNKTDCNEGAYLEDGLELVKTQGDCLEKSFNYEKHDCQTQPGEGPRAEAAAYRIQDFAAVFALDEAPKSKIGKACKILATNTPIVVGLGVSNSFFEILPGATAWNPADNETISGYHALVLVGYNSVEQYFELMNSFGASWGQNGFIRIPFDDFERLCRYAYVMSPPLAGAVANTASAEAPKTRPDMVLSGEFVFRQPAGFVSNEAGEELMYFEEITTRRDSMATGLYQTERPTFKAGDVFQLVAREIPSGRYVYVFSQSPDGAVNQHFPRKQSAVASAGFVIGKTVEIVIPGEESLLQIPSAGEDYLCILYSHAPIPGFEARLQALEQAQLPFPDKVQAHFKDILLPLGDVQYAAGKMAFSAIARPDAPGLAALIMLRVKAE